MKKAGVVVDNYKLKRFRTNLKNAGFKWHEVDGITKDTTSLIVAYDQKDFDALFKIVEESNAQTKEGTHCECGYHMDALTGYKPIFGKCPKCGKDWSKK